MIVPSGDGSTPALNCPAAAFGPFDWPQSASGACKSWGGGGCGKSTGPAEQPRPGSPGAWFLFPQSEPVLPPLEAASHGAEQGTRLQHHASVGGDLPSVGPRPPAPPL